MSISHVYYLPLNYGELGVRIKLWEIKPDQNQGDKLIEGGDVAICAYKGIEH